VCVHTGTIPSKMLREAILYLSGFQQRTFYGRGYVVKDRIAMSDLVFRAQAVMTHEVEVIKAQLRRNEVTTFVGDARFKDAHTIEIQSEDGVQLRSGQRLRHPKSRAAQICAARAASPTIRVSSAHCVAAK
jgi:NAD(P) transhydrogenase